MDRTTLRRYRFDVALALLVGLVQGVGMYFASRHQTGRVAIDGLAIALLAAAPAALVARRRYPGTVLVFVFAVTLAYALRGYPQGPLWLPLIVAFFTAIMEDRRVLAWVVLALGYVGFMWLPDAVGSDHAPNPAYAAGIAAWLLVLLIASEFARSRRERAIEAKRTREEESRRRVSDERLRIARELHDVVAHNISLINVQAGVALHLIDEQPEQARTALAAIKDASKEALTELRSVLGVLRDVDEDAPRAPAPSLERLQRLVASAEAIGVPVDVNVRGARRALPVGVDVAAFRIVQEALTNVSRHAGPARATVSVTYDDEAVTVAVEDDGYGAPASQPAGGNGIVGMRERVAALGGELEVGPRDGGGYRVLARLPVAGSS